MVAVPADTPVTVTVFVVLVTVATDVALEADVVVGDTPPLTVKASGSVVKVASIVCALKLVMVGTEYTVTTKVVLMEFGTK